MSEFEELEKLSYAQVADVAAMNQGRPAFTATSQPNVDQVANWLAQTAGVLNGLLRERGYLTPVGAGAATSTLKTLENFNAIGAWFHVESSAKQSNRLKEAETMWKWAQKMLRDGLIELDAPIDTEEALPRGGYARTEPFFTRNMEL